MLSMRSGVGARSEQDILNEQQKEEGHTTAVLNTFKHVWVVGFHFRWFPVLPGREGGECEGLEDHQALVWHSDRSRDEPKLQKNMCLPKQWPPTKKQIALTSTANLAIPLSPA